MDAVAAMIYKNFGKEEDGDAIMAGKAADQERERERRQFNLGQIQA